MGGDVQCPTCEKEFAARLPRQRPSSRDAEPPPRKRSLDDDDDRPRRGRRYEADEDERPRRGRRRDDDDEDDDEPRGRRRRDAEEDEEERPRRKKKKGAAAKKNFSERLLHGETKVLLFLKIAVGLAVCGLMYYAVSQLGKPRNVIADSQWREYEIPNTLKIDLPGHPDEQQMSVGPGFSMKMYSVMFAKDAVFGIGVSDGKLPPERARLPVEELLNDACDGSARNLEAMGGKEVRRKSITYGEYPGKELVVDVRAGGGQMVSRCYLVNGRMIIILAGGRGFNATHPNVKRMFDSLRLDPAFAVPPLKG
jgi:hypothetical protein